MADVFCRFGTVQSFTVRPILRLKLTKLMTHVVSRHTWHAGVHTIMGRLVAPPAKITIGGVLWFSCNARLIPENISSVLSKKDENMEKIQTGAYYCCCFSICPTGLHCGYCSNSLRKGLLRAHLRCFQCFFSVPLNGRSSGEEMEAILESEGKTNQL